MNLHITQPPHALRLRRQCGFSLVELLVSVAIGLVLTLIVTVIIARQEGFRRTLTSGNDLTSNSAYVSYVLDRELRSAGTGVSQGWANTVGCTLWAARSGAQILPRPSPFPAPFASIPTNVTLAPVLIHAGAGLGGSDVLAVTAGASGLGEVVRSILPGSAAAGQVRLSNTLGLRAGDLVMVSEATRGCMLQQVTTPFTGGASQELPFGGTYARDVIDGTWLANFGSANNAYLAVLGNVAGNQPRFQLLGLGANNTLVSHDLLNLNGLDAPQPITEGVVELRALYGVADATGNLTNWVAPSGPTFGIGALTDGTVNAQQTLRSIVAIRVGVVLRSDLVERNDVSANSLTLFGALPGGLAYTYNVPAGQERQRFRAVEFTVPLRNVQFTY